LGVFFTSAFLFILRRSDVRVPPAPPFTVHAHILTPCLIQKILCKKMLFPSLAVLFKIKILHEIVVL
ncbi:MAG: hypothetical protein PHI20_05295, partial [Endomicrobiaceae bacterium]|nr:hypothetical protein [Endomicrobiaceae bacterium]